MTTIKSYQGLMELDSYLDRFNYLKLDGKVSVITFGGSRYLNQVLYASKEWDDIRREVILRDNGYDMAHEEHPINGNIYVHHIVPITIDDLLNHRRCVMDLNNLISVSFRTHNAIHYGNGDYIKAMEIVERSKYDTCPWRVKT